MKSWLERKREELADAREMHVMLVKQNTADRYSEERIARLDREIEDAVRYDERSKLPPSSERVHIGTIQFDSGSLLVGDPAYTSDITHEQLMDASFPDDDVEWNGELITGSTGYPWIAIGGCFKIASFGGDISAEVYVDRNATGPDVRLVTAVHIEFKDITWDDIAEAAARTEETPESREAGR